VRSGVDPISLGGSEKETRLLRSHFVYGRAGRSQGNHSLGKERTSVALRGVSNDPSKEKEIESLGGGPQDSRAAFCLRLAHENSREKLPSYDLHREAGNKQAKIGNFIQLLGAPGKLGDPSRWISGGRFGKENSR